MKSSEITISRQTRETDIRLSLDLDQKKEINLDTSLPFFDHLLHAMAFHGGFYLSVKASGDTKADPHHLVEDTGIVLGQALQAWIDNHGPVQRFGHSVIPMDEALAETTIDVSGRGHLVYRGDFPQSRCGDFDTALIKEFFLGVIRTGSITLHCEMRYGENSHHMLEALFKSFGKAVKMAYSISEKGVIQSTKGVL